MKLRTSADLARLIKNARVAQNLTQQDVADAVGITRQSLARLERGNGGTSFDTVLRILDRLDIRLDATDASQAPSPPALSLSDAAQAAAAALAQRTTSLASSTAFDALPKQAVANLDSPTVSNLRDSLPRLSPPLPVPGSVMRDAAQTVLLPPLDAPNETSSTQSNTPGGAA